MTTKTVPSRLVMRSALDGADDGVDVSLIREMLSLTPAERLAALQRFTDRLAELADELAAVSRCG